MSACSFLSQLSTQSDYARGPFIFSIKCLRAAVCFIAHMKCTARCCHFPVDQASRFRRCKWTPTEQRPINPCTSVIRPRQPASLIHYFSIKIYCEQRAALARFIMKRPGKLNNMLERYDVYARADCFILASHALLPTLFIRPVSI